MNVKHGKGTTQYGPGVSIELTGDEVATAIDAYLVAHGVHVDGPRTITVNGELCSEGHVYVDPSGFVITDGEKLSGRGCDGEKWQVVEFDENTLQGRVRSNRAVFRFHSTSFQSDTSMRWVEVVFNDKGDLLSVHGA